ncbi:MAG TPA: hypothetical protein VG123_19980 [Streptosporangiaceae bacterium]|nr:hypothetical protein [Streptosporangiaceae bacterium]
MPSPPGGDRERRDDADGGVGEQHQGGLRAGSGGAQGGQQASSRLRQGERGEAAGGRVMSNRAVGSILNSAVAPAASPPAGCW